MLDLIQEAGAAQQREQRKPAQSSEWRELDQPEQLMQLLARGEEDGQQDLLYLELYKFFLLRLARSFALQ